MVEAMAVMVAHRTMTVAMEVARLLIHHAVVVVDVAVVWVVDPIITVVAAEAVATKADDESGMS